MSADRYEIIYREKPEFVTAECSIEIRFGNRSLHLFSGCSFLETHIAGAIRQQARDLEQLRADLAAAVAERDELRAERGDILTQRFEAVARAEQAEARLAAIEAAPAVAVIDQGEEGPIFADLTFEFECYEKPISIGTELIARPAKD